MPSGPDFIHFCQNIPIKYGINTAKWVVLASLIFIMVELIYVTIRLFNSAYIIMGYYFAFILIPFGIYVMILTLKAKEKSQWKNISDIMKIYIIAGILSMFFIKLYAVFRIKMKTLKYKV